MCHWQELNVEWANRNTVAITNSDQVRIFQQTSFFNSVSRQPKGDGGTIDRKFQFAQQKLQSANMVFVAVCCNATNDAIFVFNKKREVRQHQINSVHVCIWEHESTVNKQEFVVLL